MDSMRHLSTSLPRQRGEHDLAADFRNAARSVTDLYRNAVASQSSARAGGYQDALDDLLAFLDKENLGLMDGEGWRVRRWATERLDTDPARQAAGNTADEDEDDAGSTTVKEDDKATERSASPEVQRKPLLPVSSSELPQENSPTARRVVSEPPQSHTAHRTLSSAVFTFESNHPYPSSNHDKDTNGDMDWDGSAPAIQAFTPASNPSGTEAVRRIQRPTRGTRHSNHNRRNNNGSNTPSSNFNLGTASGSKRKLPYSDFFDISGINDGSDCKDGCGTGRAGKRRHV